jgi:hypothetical protein
MRLMYGLLASLTVLLVPAARAGGADSAHEAFYAREWDYQMAESPLWASSLGDLRWNAILDDVSLAASRNCVRCRPRT